MGKYEKLISEIQNLNKNLRFDELSKVLNNMGYSPKTQKAAAVMSRSEKPVSYP